MITTDNQGDLREGGDTRPLKEWCSCKTAKEWGCHPVENYPGSYVDCYRLRNEWFWIEQLVNVPDIYSVNHRKTVSRLPKLKKTFDSLNQDDFSLRQGYADYKSQVIHKKN
jgi:hypothetical protein